MTIKYEPVFGDQSLFYGAPEDAEYAGWFCQEVRWYMILNGKILFSDGGTWCTSDNPYLSADIAAMRRIIKEPKRWTWEDKKAGRLPEVGALLVDIETGDQFSFVGVIAGSKRWACKDTCDGLIYFFKSHEMSPIETPAEKAQRLRDEWCSECTSKYYPRGHKGFPEMIYDALLSGELPMPKKGGE